MIEVREYNQLDQLEQLRPDWQRLWALQPQATFFQSWEWLQAYWPHQGQGQKLRVLAVCRDGAVTGIVPLVVRREKTRLGTLRVLTYPLDGWATFYAPVAADLTDSLHWAIRHIRRTRRDWDLLELRWVRTPDESQATFQALESAGLTPDIAPWETSAWIDLTAGWEAYWKSRTSPERNKIRRAEKRLAAEGPVQLIRYRTTPDSPPPCDPRWDLYDACHGVAARSWQGAAADGTTLSSESVQAIYRAAHRSAAECGVLDLCLLMAGHEPAAFAYSYHRQGYLYVIKVGFDPRLQHCAPGKVLWSRLIQDSCQRGDRVIDLGPESFHYKKTWMTTTASTARLSYYAAQSPRAQALRLGRWLTQGRQSAPLPPVPDLAFPAEGMFSLPQLP